jgi:hypothetical protein
VLDTHGGIDGYPSGQTAHFAFLAGGPKGWEFVSNAIAVKLDP